nr:bifunctional epoxide hydrolase 2 [Tanacetum cinerariifolium]
MRWKAYSTGQCGAVRASFLGITRINKADYKHDTYKIGLVWRAQLEAFAAEGWRCIAPDLRGFGDSAAPTAKEAYAMQEMVLDMVELQAHLGGKAAIWVGHDWGSPIVASLAA